MTSAPYQSYAVRSDVHGRVDLSRKQFEQARAYAGLFDLGDVEVEYVDETHPLRQGQEKGQQTMDVIIRNSLNQEGTLTEIAQEAIRSILTSAALMNAHVKDTLTRNFFYRGIAGNAAESWTRIFEALAEPNQQKQLSSLFEEFVLIRECLWEKVGESIVIYLPWKAPLETVSTTLNTLRNHDPERIVVFSHDYLTKCSLKREWREKIKPMQNEEQVTMVLDHLSERESEIVLCYGHIGFAYEAAEIHFKHLGKRMTAYHTDEKGGELLQLEL